MTQAIEKKQVAVPQRVESLEDLEQITGFGLADLAEMVKPGGAAPQANTAQLITFCLTAHAHGLDPRKKQCYYIPRGGRYTFQTGIDGYAAIAARTGRDGGVDPPRYRGHLVVGRGKLDVPEEVEVTIWKLVGPTYIPRPFTGVASWTEYAPSDIDDNGSSTWRKYPRRMLAKCATAQALRMAFPEQLGEVEFANEGEHFVEVAERQPLPQPQLNGPAERRSYDDIFESDDETDRRMDEQASKAKVNRTTGEVLESPQAQAIVDQAHDAAALRKAEIAEIDRQRRQEGLI